MFEYKPDINDMFEFKWTDYDYSDKRQRKIYGSLIGKFKIGQGVIVIGDMNFYSSYVPMLNAMLFDKIDMRHELNDDECGVIVGRKYHEKKNDLIYGVRMECDNKIALVGEKGLKKDENYMNNIMLEDKLFEI